MITKILFPKNTYDVRTSVALLLMRVVFAGMLVTHGWDKLIHFETTVAAFAEMGGKATAILVVFAEFFCALGVVVGLLYRLALIPMIINMAVAFFIAHGAKLTGEHNGELAFLYLVAFIVLAITGPGKLALDNLFTKKSGV